MKKKPSGSEYRKRKAEKEKEFQQTKKFMSLDKYIETKQSNEGNLEQGVPSCSTASTSIIEPCSVLQNITETRIDELPNKSKISPDLAPIFKLPHNRDDPFSKITNAPLELGIVNLSDVGTWPAIRNSKTIDHIIAMGPTQIRIDRDNFPKDGIGRHFASSHYSRKLANNEIIPRRWLVYSISKDRVFCFCCRLFDRQSASNLVSEGYNNWKHLSETLKMHENSTFHKKCYYQWFEAEIRLKRGKTIDREEQKLISRETLRWNNVLFRLMNIILYLAENNMAFRGTSDKLYTPNNGKFLGLVQLIGKFDPIIQEHLKLAMAGDISDHYCGKNIQAELINLMGEKVKSEIVSRARNSKYYSIIADCTPDISHIEQLSLTIRFADLSDNNISIKEHFIEFIPVGDSSDAGLTEVILNVLNKHGLELHNCRGQGYDNGANMKGKNIGVQKRILDLNPLAFFVPCGCHSYNLVLCDAAKSSVKSVTLFGVLQRLFTLFSGSVNRWKILTDHLGLYSLKKTE